MTVEVVDRHRRDASSNHLTTNEYKTNAPRNAGEVVDTAGRLRLSDYPALASLRLVDEDLYELAHQ